MKPTARSVALDALALGGDAAEHLDRELSQSDIAPRDRALATELAYGTLKMRRALEWSVQSCLTRPLANVEPRLRWILLLGAYQLLYLDRVPAHSAVDESVDLARSGGHAGTAGLANAVLRKIAITQPRPPKPAAGSDAASLGVYASLPDWIAAHFIARFGHEEAIRVAEGVNGSPRRALRVDTGRRSVESVSDQLSSQGVAVSPGRYAIPECLILERIGSRAAVRDVVQSGDASWQSEESQLAVHVLDPRPGEIILDVCAGRGVKTMMIARRLEERGAVWSLDDAEQKLSKLAASTKAAKMDVVRAVRCNAQEPYPAEVPVVVDAALVDAPCSGLGVIGRHPDARWRKSESDPRRFSIVQARVLRQAASRVRAGGRLLYVTCSTHPLEDEAVVEAFLSEDSQWQSQAPPMASLGSVVSLGSGALTVPGIEGADGFYYALLKRA